MQDSNRMSEETRSPKPGGKGRGWRNPPEPSPPYRRRTVPANGSGPEFADEDPIPERSPGDQAADRRLVPEEVPTSGEPAAPRSFFATRRKSAASGEAVPARMPHALAPVGFDEPILEVPEPQPMRAGTIIPEDPLSGRSFPRSRTRRLVWGLFVVLLEALRLVATVLLVFGLFGAASYLILQAYIGGREVSVPRVQGATLEEALEKIKPSGLLLELESRRYSEGLPRGYIIAQAPDPGARVKSRTPLRVVVSDGAARVPAPNLIGQTENQAGVLARAFEDHAGVKVDLDIGRKSYTYSGTAPKGDVIAQEPPPGMPISRDGRINILVSLGLPQEPTAVSGAGSATPRGIALRNP